jgi:protein FrlC
MNLSFCTMGYLEYCTVEETVKRIAALGYDGIDFWAYSPHLGPDIYDRQERKDVLALVKRHHLKVTGLAVAGGALNLNLNISHSNPKIRRKSIDYLKECVDLAADMEAPLINLISGHKVYGTSQSQAWQWNRDAIEEVADHAEPKGIIVALHSLTPAESTVMVTLDELLTMKEQVNRKNVKLCIDTADQNVTDPNLQSAILKAGKDLVHFHLNDNHGEKRGDIHLPPGRGNVNWEIVLRTLSEIEYDGCLMVQAHSIGSPVDIDGWALESINYVKNLLSKFNT